MSEPVLSGFDRAERNIRWIQRRCVVPDGADVGHPVDLRPWQQEIIHSIYGSPTRRAIISFGRKNGKTALAAFLTLLHLCGPESKTNTQLYSAAQAREQAAVLFELAAKIVRMSPSLAGVIKIRDTAKELLCPAKGTFYKALSAEVSTSFGKSPIFIVHDELGQVKGPRSPLYSALETACSAHKNPLSVVISTQAATDADLLSVLIDDAKTGANPKIKLVLYTADPEADPFAEETIKQANPAFDDFQNAEEIRELAADANRMPSSESEYRNLNLNQRVDRNDPFISKSVWQENGETPSEDWGESPVYAALDLSATADLTAFAPISYVKDKWETKPIFWLPEEGLEAKSRQDRETYDLWAEQGFLNTTPGRSVQYEFVAHRLFDFCQTHNVRKIAFDRWGMKYLIPWLLKAGFTDEQVGDNDKDGSLFARYGQGFQSMSPALRDLESVLLNGGLRHGNHPVLSMCAANAVVTADPAGGRKLNKAKAAGRIDGMVALTMAFGIAPLDAPEPNVDDWLASLAA